MSTLVTGGGDLRLAAGTGTVQISAPTDTDPTGQSLVLTLPQTIGSANQVLRNSGTAGTLEFADPGKVLQVVNAIKKDTASTNSTSAVATGLQLSITPKASTSKILLTASVGICGTNLNDFGVFYYFGLGGSVITDALGDADSARTRCGTFARSSTTVRGYSSVMVYEHDHDSSSQLTYSLMFSAESGSTAFINRSGNDADSANRPRSFSTLTAMEISA